MTSNQNDEDEHWSTVIKGGALGGAAGLALGIGGVTLASRRYPAFRSLTLPFRAFLVTSAATFGGIVSTDRCSIAYQRAQFPEAGYRDRSARAADDLRAHASPGRKALDWAAEHRYPIVCASWVVGMALSLALVSRSPMSKTQKVVQARVYAQGITLAVIVATAALGMNDAQAGGRWETVKVLDPDDPDHKHFVEKKIHKEQYEGQNLWMDMVDAEERRMQAAQKRVSETNTDTNKS